MTIKTVGAGCTLPAAITVVGSVLSQALNTAEVIAPEFKFEPTVKTTYTWRQAGAVHRGPSGLTVGGEQTEMSGTMFFSLMSGFAFSVT